MTVNHNIDTSNRKSYIELIIESGLDREFYQFKGSISQRFPQIDLQDELVYVVEIDAGEFKVYYVGWTKFSERIFLHTTDLTEYSRPKVLMKFGKAVKLLSLQNGNTKLENKLTEDLRSIFSKTPHLVYGGSYTQVDAPQTIRIKRQKKTARVKAPKPISDWSLSEFEIQDRLEQTRRNLNKYPKFAERDSSIKPLSQVCFSYRG